MVLLVTITACSGDDTPANTVFTGNTELLDFYEEFTPPRRGTKTEEYRSSTQNSKVFEDSIDIDRDGLYDFRVKYFLTKRIDGDTSVTTLMGPLHENMFFLGDTVMFDNMQYWDQRVYQAGKEVNTDTNFWETKAPSGYLYSFDYWLKFQGGGFIDELTKFPAVPEGYIAFKLYSGEKTILGWYKVRLAHPGRVPEIESIGYRQF